MCPKPDVSSLTSQFLKCNLIPHLQHAALELSYARFRHGSEVSSSSQSQIHSVLKSVRRTNSHASNINRIQLVWRRVPLASPAAREDKDVCGQNCSMTS